MDNYITVSQVNNYIKGIFDAELMLQNIYVYGEISSFNISGGNAYFNIKDENSLLPCMLFGASKFANPKIGDMVLLRGSMSYYAKGGRLSFIASTMQPYGKGLLYEKFLELKNNLEEKGYFAAERKKEIPPRVSRIGVITSATGAVIQDIIDVTTRRNSGVDIVLYPVKVQGVGAEHEIAQAINFFSTYDNIDVVIVARGGGSMEDLQPFNTEMVATAAYNCKKPLVSAVGHETDYTILDFVADLRAPTPSAAAELVVWSKQDEVAGIFALLDRVVRQMQYKISGLQNTVEAGVERICNSITRKIDTGANVVSANFAGITNSIEVKIVNREYLVKSHEQLIVKLNPARLAGNGYIRVRRDGKVVKSIAEVQVDDLIECEFLDGALRSQINKIIKKDK